MGSEQTQFKSGNGGRPKGSLNKTTQHRAALAKALGEEGEVEVWEVVIKAANDGDVQAARLIMEYLHGKPRQVHELETDFGLQHVTFNVVPWDHEKGAPLSQTECSSSRSVPP